MAFDKEGFEITEKGFQEDLKKLKETLQKDLEMKSRLKTLKDNHNHMQQRLNAGQAIPGMEHMKEKAIISTEMNLKLKANLDSQKKKESFDQMFAEEKERLTNAIYGSSQKRDDLLKQAEVYNQNKNKTEKARKDFNELASRQKVENLRNKIEYDNKSIEKTNYEKKEAAVRNVMEGKSVAKIDFQKTTQSKGKEIE